MGAKWRLVLPKRLINNGIYHHPIYPKREHLDGETHSPVTRTVSTFCHFLSYSFVCNSYNKEALPFISACC